MANLFDARDYKIPNELILLGYAAGLFLNIQNFQWTGIFIFIIKAIVPILTLYLLFRSKGLGAGDIKLFSVLCTHVGIEFTTEVMIKSVLFAGLAVIGLIITEKGINIKRRLHYSFYMTAAFFFCLISNK